MAIISRHENAAFRKITKHFSYKEFFCRCGICLNQTVSEDLVNRLELLRDVLGQAVHINSGYRCPRHNEIMGSSIHSQHVLGKAADVYVQGMRGWQVAKKAFMLGFTGIGVAEHWCHLDVREVKDGKTALWVYAPLDLEEIRVKVFT